MIDAVIDIHHAKHVDPNSGFHDIKASGVLAVILKAGQGKSMTDPKFAERSVRAKSAGLLVGAYYFGTNSSPGKSQADRLLSIAGGTSRLALDWEGYESATMSRAEAEAFVQRIYEKTGQWPMLYSGLAFLAAQMKGLSAADTSLSNCPLWLARYGPMPTSPKPFTHWTLWQYTSSGACPGVTGAVDRSKFKGDAAALQTWWTSGQ